MLELTKKICKRIGYGSEEPIWNREKMEAIQESDLLLMDFRVWVEQNRDLCIEILNKTKANNFYEVYRKNLEYNLITWTSFTTEYIANLFTFSETKSDFFVLAIPELYHLSSRDGDLIDLCEAALKNETWTPEKIGTLTEIYPFEGMELIPGNEIPNTEFLKKVEKELCIDLSDGFIFSDDYFKILRKVPNTTLQKYFARSYHPKIPESVILILYYLNVLNDFYVDIHKIYPLLYTYWR